MGDLKISLPLYEGPLDLLLDLIRRQKTLKATPISLSLDRCLITYRSEDSSNS